MTPALEMQLGSFRKIDILASRSDQEIEVFLEKVPFLRVFSKEGSGKMVRF